MKDKLQVLYKDNELTIVEQRDGSLSLIQESNDARDTQQVIVLNAKQWQQVLGTRELLIVRAAKGWN